MSLNHDIQTNRLLDDTINDNFVDMTPTMSEKQVLGASERCLFCYDAPCITACPVSALRGSAPYAVPSCHAFLGTEEGADCMGRGCKVRRACPISQGFGRSDAQSAHHMRSIHPSPEP